MWKSAYVGVYQLLNWKMHSETLKYVNAYMFTLTHKLCAWTLVSVYGQAGYRLRGTEYKITHNQWCSYIIVKIKH